MFKMEPNEAQKIVIYGLKNVNKLPQPEADLNEWFYLVQSEIPVVISMACKFFS